MADSIIIHADSLQLVNVAILIIPTLWYSVDEILRAWMACRPFSITSMQVHGLASKYGWLSFLY